jgi:hypothetical protein
MPEYLKEKMLGKRQLSTINDILSVDFQDVLEYKHKRSKLDQIVVENSEKNLNEDYARGIPDFALSQVASDTAEELKRLLKMHITQSTRDPSEQRRKLSAASVVLDELEEEIKEKLEDKLLQFLRST